MFQTLRHAYQQRLHRFINARIAQSDQQAFGLKNTYVFFSRQGFLFALMLATTFVAGVNYGNNLILGLVFYLASIWLVAVVITFTQVSSLSITIHPPTMTQAGKLLWVDISLHNRQGRPARQIQLYFDEKSDSGLLEPNDVSQYQKHQTATIASVDKNATVRLPIIAHRRGHISLPRLVIKSQYPLGVIQAWGYARPKSTALAYPKPKPIDTQHLAHSQHGDEQSLHQQKGQDDFERLDNYQLGESLSRVSWGHLARGLMLTKHFGNPTGQTLTLDYHAMPSPNHEDKLAMLTFLVLGLKDSTQPFMLILPSGQGELGMGASFIDTNLRRLAQEP